jgi:hypothetical protein
VVTFSWHVLSDNFNCTAIFCEFKGVGLKIEQDLLNSGFIAQNVVVGYTFSFAVFFKWKADKIAYQFDILRFCFIHLDCHNILNRLLDVEHFYVLVEFSCSNLREAQYIFDI